MLARLARRAADLRRTVPAAALSLSVAAAAMSPAPARADNDDLRRALAALAALGIIAYAIDERNDRERERERARRPVAVPEPPRHPAPERPSRPRGPGFLPAACVVENGTRPHEYGTRRDRRVVGERCLRRSNIRIGRLPDACRGTVHIGGRDRPTYGFACLREAGYRFR